ncbi:hypothetical protein Cni_G06249 [Canna indica]|uniref:Nodulation signaling pathway 1-like protein n=1 Tax=Canna indica TaxID=4628 RepID=A0AAQ3JZT8_9LILI|nr:hypothetical protein Cni_G06249 [Canna indica]
MTFDGGQKPNSSPDHQQQHHLLDWLEDSMSLLSSFIDDTYTRKTTADEITSYEWWAQEQEQANMNCTPSPSPIPTTSSSSALFPQAEFSKKRKQLRSPATANKAATLQNRQREAGNEGNGVFVEEGEVNKKPAATGRKAQAKGSAGSSSNGGSKEPRWAEQLLNPCAAAIEVSNISRARHLFCVLEELQSFSGDANHRLAAHGLRALSNHLSSAGISIPDRGGAAAAPTFATAEPKLFQSSLIKFHEVSPWFAFPNALANASILQTVTLNPGRRAKSLHVVDLGVSHGVQWPTLLDAIARRPGSAPPVVRLTVAGSATPPGPFSAPPPGYDFRSHLLRYAKSIDLNLQIDHADDLGAETLALARGDTLVVCVQFRAGHVRADNRAAFLQSIRELDPDLVVLSEIDGGGGDEVEGRLGFPAAFAKNAELLWRFLDSTSAAFRGRDCAERQVMEGEAARVLQAVAAEGRERWRERMLSVGFQEGAFEEEAVDAGRALLRKYDGNWEMRTAAAGEAAVGLWWKGHPVCFCSLWKPHRRS